MSGFSVRFSCCRDRFWLDLAGKLGSLWERRAIGTKCLMDLSWDKTKPLYQEVVRKLNLDADCAEEGSKILKNIIDLQIKPDTHKKGPWVWIVCGLFIVGFEQHLQTMDGKMSRGAGVKLTSLLQVKWVPSCGFLASSTFPAKLCRLYSPGCGSFGGGIPGPSDSADPTNVFKRHHGGDGRPSQATVYDNLIGLRQIPPAVVAAGAAGLW